MEPVVSVPSAEAGLEMQGRGADAQTISRSDTGRRYHRIKLAISLSEAFDFGLLMLLAVERE